MDPTIERLTVKAILAPTRKAKVTLLRRISEKASAAGDMEWSKGIEYTLVILGRI
jgi:hypothetical protein